MTIDKLKELFLEKYKDSIFLTPQPQILVVLTKDEYEELNQDLTNMMHTSGILLLVDEADMKYMDPEDILYTRINIPKMCEFIIELGNEFVFKLVDEEQEHGDESL